MAVRDDRVYFYFINERHRHHGWDETWYILRRRNHQRLTQVDTVIGTLPFPKFLPFRFLIRRLAGQ